MSATYALVENDSGIELKVQCMDYTPNTPIDLTGCSVLLRWRSVNGIEERPMNIIGAPQGVVNYVFQEGEIVAPDMEFELQIINSLGEKRTSLQTFRERVRERLGPV